MNALLEAAPFLSSIGAGVALLWILGRDRTADEHTVDDYRPTLATSRRDWPLVDRQGPRRLRAGALAALDVLPPAPPGIRVSLPLYAEQVVAELMRERYGTTSAAAIAGGFLREIAADAKTGDVIWGSRATDRDLTGVFPVVRAA